jgi:hypothetical protein
MHLPESRGQELEHAELASDPLTSPIAAAVRRRIGMYQLPDPRHLIRRICCHQLVKKRGARARQAGDKDRPLDPLVEDLWHPTFLCPHPEQIAQQAADVPAGPEMTEEAQLRLLEAGTQKNLQSLLEWPIAEIFKFATAPRSFDQIRWVQSLVQEHGARGLSLSSAGKIGCRRASTVCALI